MNDMLKPASSGRIDTKRLTFMAILVCMAAVVSVIEGMFPPIIPLAPGAKLGLGNIAPLIALIILGPADAYVVMLVKCFLGALISGGLSGLMYSVPAGVLSLGIEIALFYLAFDKMSVAGISLVGAVAFNVVQLFMACAITGVNLLSLLPMLMTAGLLAGAFTGLLTYYIVKKLPYSVYGGRR